MKRPQYFEPGDQVAWYMGPTQLRGQVVKVLRNGDELIVRSLAGVLWNLAPAHQQVDLLGPLPTDAEWMGAIR